MTKGNLAVIGASYLQLPLIRKAKAMGYKTHVFAWAAGDVGEGEADVFYPISIVEKEQILEKCREIGIQGICTIASDLAAITVNYVAAHLNLPGNSLEATFKSTNKHAMRKAFEANGDPSPRSLEVDENTDLQALQLTMPVIVKPTDRSGSRGITLLSDPKDLNKAVACAMDQGFQKKALIEEFAEGQEYSVEYCSCEGMHHFLAVTEKFTTGAPHFIETAHLQPARISQDLLAKIQTVVPHALDSLGLTCGASHSELKIDKMGNIKLIEIGGRMGGDCIGSHLVPMTTGVDFVKAVIETAVGEVPDLQVKKGKTAAIRFIFTGKDLEVLERLKKEHPQYLVSQDVHAITEEAVTDSGSRFGYFLMEADSSEDLLSYLPRQEA